MKFTITKASMQYVDEKIEKVEVHFEAREQDYSVTINGYFVFTKEEFEGKSFSELIEEIKSKLTKRILNPMDIDVVEDPVE